jgi:predicted TIM-barrel fold metal-dependent hydrolase
MTGIETTESPSARVRTALNHPVIDADGHTVEYVPALASYLRAEGLRLNSQNPLGDLGISPPWLGLSAAERAHRRAYRTSWWTFPGNADDLATAMIPKLMYSRLDEMGIDFSVVYPSAGLTFLHIEDDDTRRAACRAVNRYHADVFADYRDRLTPAAVVPMQHPDEAIAGLEHAVLDLGLKAVLIASYAKRPVRAAIERAPAVGEWAYWLDTFGLDSDYDYDPFWARCIELGISIAAHSVTMGMGTRQSITNYMHNHIGHFAAAGEGLCRGLVLGGVTRRFPRLRVALLEGGAAWGVSLLNDLYGHWTKRGRDSITQYDPAHIDRKRFDERFGQYGGQLAGLSAAEPTAYFDGQPALDPSMLDEFEAAGFATAEDIRDRFLPNFFFGCEGDDPLVGLAFDPSLNPFGARLSAMYGSDIGHWDVPDMREVLVEAYEGVEKGHLSQRDFRDFSFVNAARFYLESNPDFFTGTRVEQDVVVLRPDPMSMHS